MFDTIINIIIYLFFNIFKFVYEVHEKVLQKKIGYNHYLLIWNTRKNKDVKMLFSLV